MMIDPQGKMQLGYALQVTSLGTRTHN